MSEKNTCGVNKSLPRSERVPSVTLASVRIHIVPGGSCRRPLWRSSFFDSGAKPDEFRVWRVRGRSTVMGKICERTCEIVGVNTLEGGDGKRDMVMDNGRMGGFFECLELCDR